MSLFKKYKAKRIAKIINLNDELQDLFMDFLHNNHNQCGDFCCVDAGGSIINDEDIINMITNDDYLNFFEEYQEHFEGLI